MAPVSAQLPQSQDKPDNDQPKYIQRQLFFVLFIYLEPSVFTTQELKHKTIIVEMVAPKLSNNGCKYKNLFGMIDVVTVVYLLKEYLDTYVYKKQ